MSTFLPTELWNDIFRRVERKDLTTLARVSCLFQQEAEYVLYRCVNVRNNTDGARLASLCMSIVGERRRASRVHTLWFPSHFDPPKPPPGELAITASTAEIRQLLAQAFKAVVNLKELYVLGNRPDDSGVYTIGPSTFENCTFSLTGIAGAFTGLTTDEMWGFLDTQPDISYWFPCAPFIKSINAIPPNTLPSVREMVLSCPERLPLLYDWPIRELVLIFHDDVHTKYDGLAVIHSLRQFKRTLRVLSYIVSGPLTDWATWDIIRAMAQDAPNIKLLRLFFVCPYRVSTDKQKDLIEAVSGFKRLYYLTLPFNMDALRDPNADPPDPWNPLELDPIWTPYDSPAQFRKVAGMFMESCPSLQRISFPFRSKRDGEMVYLRYERSRSGGGRTMGRAEAWLEGFYEMDPSSWWMR